MNTVCIHACVIKMYTSVWLHHHLHHTNDMHMCDTRVPFKLWVICTDIYMVQSYETCYFSFCNELPKQKNVTNMAEYSWSKSTIVCYRRYFKSYGQEEASGSQIFVRPLTKCPTNTYFVSFKLSVEFKVTLLNG